MSFNPQQLRDLPEMLQPALQIFIEELSAHAVYFQSVLPNLDSHIAPGADLRQALISRFHKIKGGAGFFKLDELKDRGAQSEKALKELNNDAWPALCPELKQQIEFFCSEAEALLQFQKESA